MRAMRLVASTLIALALALASAAVPAGAAQEATATASLGKVADRARDCVADTFVDTSHPEGVGFVVWCGTQSGKVRFTLKQRKEGYITSFSKRATAEGHGAGSAFRCHLQGETVKCVGRKQGPVTIRGWVTVAPGSRCDLSTMAETAESIYVGLPHGCPGTKPPRPPRDMGYFRGFRRQFGLDPDLHGNRAAIDRRIRGLIRAWERGNPVARYTTSNLGLPLRPRDQTELDFRGDYLEQINKELDEWVPHHARDTYAGYDMDHEHGGIIYIGFVGDQEAQLEAFLGSFKPIAPGRIKPFPVPPRYSEVHLWRLAEEAWEPPTSRLGELINAISVDTLANVVTVGTEHVAVVRRLIAAKYGSDAPFRVEFAGPIELL